MAAQRKFFRGKTLQIPQGNRIKMSPFFVRGLVTENWYVWGQTSPRNWALGEFEAFAPLPVPEPATMTLLALGGLAMLRRRR